MSFALALTPTFPQLASPSGPTPGGSLARAPSSEASDGAFQCGFSMAPAPLSRGTAVTMCLVKRMVVPEEEAGDFPGGPEIDPKTLDPDKDAGQPSLPQDVVRAEALCCCPELPLWAHSAPGTWLCPEAVPQQPAASGGPRGACREGEREVGCLMPCLSVFRDPSGHGPVRWSPPQHPDCLCSQHPCVPGPFNRSVNSPGALYWGLRGPLHPAQAFGLKCLQITHFESNSCFPPAPASSRHLWRQARQPPCHRPTQRLWYMSALQARAPGSVRGPTAKPFMPRNKKRGLLPEPSSEAQGLLFQLYFIFS